MSLVPSKRYIALSGNIRKGREALLKSKRERSGIPAYRLQLAKMGYKNLTSQRVAVSIRIGECPCTLARCTLQHTRTRDMRGHSSIVACKTSPSNSWYDRLA